MRKVLQFLLILIVTISCNKNNQCIEYKEALVTKAEAPSVGKVDEDVLVKVEAILNSGCGQFDKFEQDSDGLIRNISVIAKYTGCICTEIAPIVNENYILNTPNAGIYILKFKTYNDELIELNIEITD